MQTYKNSVKDGYIQNGKLKKRKKKIGGKKSRASSWASAVGYIMLAFDTEFKRVGLGQQLKDYEIIIFLLW